GLSDKARGSGAFELSRFRAHALVLAAVLAVILAPGLAAKLLFGLAGDFLKAFDWLVLFSSTAMVVLCAVLALSPFGKLRLGGAAARPEFGRLSWWAMLFATGMGAGLVFWGAAEPLIHTASPPPHLSADSQTGAERIAFSLTLLHWAVHPWAIYALSALTIAFFAFRRGAPLLPSAPFRSGKAGPPSPLLNVIDWVALIAVLFGVVASMGQGILQMTAGLSLGFEGLTPETRWVQLVLLCVLATVFLASAAGGLDRGIKPLSDLNMALACLLLAFVFIAGPTADLAARLVGASAAYLQDLTWLSTYLTRAGEGGGWTRDWTLTYFLWWVSWGPFVGVFVARISRGRTIRDFLAGVVLIPSLFTLAWFGVMGGAGLHAEYVEGRSLGIDSFESAPLATYALLASYPLAELAQVITGLLVFIFLVTSADSGAYVLAVFSRQGQGTPPVSERLFWGAVIAGLTAGALMTGEGQRAMRVFAITGSIPLLFLLLAQIGRLLWALREERPNRDGLPD
ncbi:MAG: BCCT family transporter, partial [Pseudomonadota bacterium]